MNQFKWIFILLLAIFSMACYSTKKLSDSSLKNHEFQYTNLIQVLRGKPNLRIMGNGDNVTVFIRGERSFFDNNEPLYLLDNNVIGTTFAEASAGIEPSTIISADVITPANAGRFGARGGNGVIIFRSKSNR